MKTVEQIKDELKLVNKFIKVTNSNLKEYPQNIDYTLKLKNYIKSREELIAEYQVLTGF